jgi:hypothetical protein
MGNPKQGRIASRPGTVALLASLAVVLARGLSAQEPSAEPIRFNRDIRPILSDRCVSCHGPDAGHRKGKLRLDDGEDAFRDRGGYQVIAAGSPDESELIARVEDEEPTLRMPPPDSGKKALTADEIGLLRRWIAQGASFERHWSLVPPRKEAPPKVQDASWPLGPVDRFLLAAIEARGLRPSPEADRVTLLRRLHFDLIGLPPTPEEVTAFVEDRRPDAHERVVDRLLASPHFGERMAIWWLDLVRYADTVGYHGDQEHHIFPYRDWVIRAWNDGMPFDQFTLEQLAGDLLPNPTIDQVVATGYNRVLQTTHEGGAQDKEYRAKYASDRVRNLTSVWMGATMACAECHDHKYDPYTQRDFYGLAAFFADIQERGAFPGPDKTPTVRAPEMEVLAPLDRAELERIEARIAEIERTLSPGPEQKPEPAEPDASATEAAKKQLEALQSQREAVKRRAVRTMITVAVEPRVIRLLPRGDWMDDSGPELDPAVPEVFGPLGISGRRPTRLDLARWLTRPDHPQTARVVVNRLWGMLFGEGLSRSLDDNGSQGVWPTHPELLDWLAVELVDSGWNVKHVLRLMATSRAYRQSSVGSPELLERDPENRLFARQARFRLPAELIRDAALEVSGLLVHRVGGRSARPYQPAGYYAPLNFPKREYQPDTDENQYRRGVYMHWQRQFLHPMLRAFDAPSREDCTARRPVSNTPLAALTLMNDPTFVEAARVLADRIVREGGATTTERVSWAWRAVLSRSPDDREAAALVRHHEGSLSHYAANPEAAEALSRVGLAPRDENLDAVERAAWTSVARALLNLHEAITRN